MVYDRFFQATFFLTQSISLIHSQSAKTSTDSAHAVAQVSQPAVSPISQSAGRRKHVARGSIRTARRLEALRYSRLGNLRYFVCRFAVLCSFVGNFIHWRMSEPP